MSSEDKLPEWSRYCVRRLRAREQRHERTETDQADLELTEDINDFLRMAIALSKVASLGKEKGRQLALIDSKSEKVVTHVVGL